jgi:arginine decarboxylase-like protein
MQLPLILRFPDILRHRMQELQACFSAAMAKFDYQVGLPLFSSSLAPNNIT